MSNVLRIKTYLQDQGIEILAPKIMPTVLDPLDEIEGASFPTVPCAKQLTEPQNLRGTLAEGMSMASMLAVIALDLAAGEKLLDVCSAPGMKGLYASYLNPVTEYYCNDLSKDRLVRLKRLFDKHGKPIAGMTHFDARFIDRAYEPESFDRILIDAPCSGEGVALGGDAELAEAWSPAKVKRLQQLQIKIVKSAWHLLSPGGRMVYATCTLNRNENERTVKKALGVELDVQESALNPAQLPELCHAQAWRILPSPNSIGFFIAVLEKNQEIE